MPHAQPSHGEFTALAAASRSQRALTCPSHHPGCRRRSGAKNWIHPSSILACQRERRAQSGSNEDAVVSKHTESCGASLGLTPALALRAAGAVPAQTNIVGPKTLGFVLQEFCESGLSSTDSAPQEHPGSHRPLCQRLPWAMEKIHTPQELWWEKASVAMGTPKLPQSLPARCRAQLCPLSCPEDL